MDENTTPAQNDQDATDAVVQDDLNKLIGTALGVAGDQLEEQGAFMPLALVVSNDGEISLVAVAPTSMDGEAEVELDADAMIDDLYEALAQQRDANRAAAVVCDIHLPDDATDAIHVVAEHRSGVSVAAVRPYAQKADGFTFSEAFLEPGEKLIWV